MGRISKVLNNDLGIEKNIIVESDVDFKELDYVAILSGGVK